MNETTELLVDAKHADCALDTPFAPVSEEVAALAILEATVTNEDVAELEKVILDQSCVHIPVMHSFKDGIYFRGITLPSGSFAVGHAHKKDCVNIMMSGCMSVLLDGKIVRLKAPAMFNGKAMQRKVAYVHEETVFITAHATTETNIEKLEDELLIKTPYFIEHEKKCGPHMNHGFSTTVEPEDAILRDQADYICAIHELGFSPEEVKAISENLEDQMALSDKENGNIVMAASQRHALGLFATARFEAGSFVTFARIGDKRTMAGRFTNHSCTPNVIFKIEGDWLLVFACRPIEVGSEILVDYRQARKAAEAHQHLTE